MRFNVKEDVVALTPLNPYGRFDDGRPKVPDELFEQLRLVGMEEAWKVLQDHGYNNQFEGNWQNLHPERTMVGRVTTATLVPARPDLNEVVMAYGKGEGMDQVPNRWPLDAVGENDVVVVDIFGKVQWGCFVGDCLAAGVASQGGAGLVIDGGIRDPQAVHELPDFNLFCRGYDPTYMKETVLIGWNGPTRIGQVTALPGDIVIGNRAGVLFIPPHLVEEVIATWEEIHTRESFIRQMLRERKYSAKEIYTDEARWTAEIKTDFDKWKARRLK